MCYDNMMHGGLQAWSVEDVVGWLQGEGGLRPRLVAAFRENRVDGATLLDVTKADLKHELEIEGLGDRKEAWAVVQRLQHLGRRRSGEEMRSMPSLPPLRHAPPVDATSDPSSPQSSVLEGTLPSLPGLSSAGSTLGGTPPRDLYRPPREVTREPRQTKKEKAHGRDKGASKEDAKPRQQLEPIGRRHGSGETAADPAVPDIRGHEWDAPDPYGGYVHDTMGVLPRVAQRAVVLPALGEPEPEPEPEPDPQRRVLAPSKWNRSERVLGELRSKNEADPVTLLEDEQRSTALFKTHHRDHCNTRATAKPNHHIPVKGASGLDDADCDPAAMELARRRSSIMRRLEHELQSNGGTLDAPAPEAIITPLSPAREVYQTTDDYKISKSWEDKLRWEAKAWEWLEHDVLGAQDELKDIEFGSPIGDGGALDPVQVTHQSIKEESSALGDAVRSVHPVTQLTQQRADYHAILNQAHQINTHNDEAYERHRAFLRSLETPQIEAGPTG